MHFLRIIVIFKRTGGVLPITGNLTLSVLRKSGIPLYYSFLNFFEAMSQHFSITLNKNVIK